MTARVGLTQEGNCDDNSALDAFIARLAQHQVDSSIVNNMYFGEDEENYLRVANLRAYLEYFIEHHPDFILIGEAPGYRGCRLSGIPFTSTKIINTSSFFEKLNVNRNLTAESEATATIVWSYLTDCDRKILFWNAYPFHPFKKSKPTSNRKPSKKELTEGKRYLDDLVSMFPEAKIVAAGRVAHDSLHSLGFVVPYVRHASYGGKSEFISGLSALNS